MIVQEVDRPIVKRWRIVRERSTRAGIATEDVRFLDGDSLTLHAVTAERAVENARRLGVTGSLRAISEES